VKAGKGLRVLLPILGACTIFAGTAAAGQAVGLFVNGKELSLKETKVENGKVVAPVRDVAEALGARVVWDQKTRSVNIETGGITKEAVESWVRGQGAEKGNYYFDGLFFEEMNLDGDPEAEVLARIDRGVHLGDFFIFDKQSDGAYRLIFEQPWRVESWEAANVVVSWYNDDFEDMNPLIEIVTRTGGAGVDIREARLMHINESGQWTEVWKGTLKDRSVFQDQYRTVMGSYQFNDDDGQLFYWQTEWVASLEDDQPVDDPQTTMKRFTLQQGKFVEQH